MRTSRRSFLGGMGGLGAAAFGLGTADPVGAGGVAFAAPVRGRAVAASDRIRVGVIGCRGMGSSNMRSMLDVDGVECAALCDVDANVLGDRLRSFEELTGGQPDSYADYRKLLEDDGIDAVIIATPDHWHCRMMVDACEAGKDVYVEKPMANSIDEVRVMQQAAKAHGRVVQVGQWQRSGQHWQDAMEYVWSGELGRIRAARAWAYMGAPAPMPAPDSEPPEGVDYDMWLGPAPKRPFNKYRFHWEFRWFWDYAGGLMTDWGVHLVDIVLMGMKVEAPRSVVSLGGPLGYPGNAYETPDTQQAIYEYGDFTMIWEHCMGIDLGPHQRGHGVSFTGNNGTLVVDRGGWEVLAETGRKDGEPYEKTPAIERRTAASGQRGLAQHTENFIDCMRSREQPRCNADVGALAAVNAHLGNIAFRTGRRVHWDHEAGRFAGDEEANALLRAEYHNGWQFPQVKGAEASAG